MVKRITELTNAQKAAIPGYVAAWIARSQSTERPDWAAVEQAIKDCYEYAGLPWHGRVVRVPSPFVGALAAPLADLLIRHDATHGAVRRTAYDRAGSVDAAVRAALDGSVGVALDGAVYDGLDGSVGVAVDSAVDVAVDRAVRGSVGGSVRRAVRGSVGDAVHAAVGGVDRAVRDAVRESLYDGLRGLRGSVSDAVHLAVSDGWGKCCGGQWWAAWQAPAAFLRDVCDLALDGDAWDRDRAFATAQSAGWWWPYLDFVMISDRPIELHLEQVREAGGHSHRLHRADGPAIAWSDGTAIWAWHGLRVPRELIEDPVESWTLERILRLDDPEIRRAAIERVGWERLEADLGAPVATAPDPANLPHELRLYDLPAELYEEPVRLVTMTNASPGRDGTIRRYGATVPAWVQDPIEATAWTWDVSPDVYRRLEPCDVTRGEIRTYRDVLAPLGVDIPPHLIADAEVPVLSGPQRQGDLLVVPIAGGAYPHMEVKFEPVGGGVQVVHGEATGHTHWLHGGPGVRWAPVTDGQLVGVVEVPDGETAYLIHTDEHGANGISAAGRYEIRRKREQADEIRDVDD